MKKIISFIMPLIMAVGVLSATVFAAEKPIFTLTIKDKFNSGAVTVGVSVKNLKANALTVNVSFDKSVVEATGSDEVQDVGYMSSINNISNANARGIFSYNMFAEEEIQYSDGALMHLTFKIKDFSKFSESSINISGVVIGTKAGQITDYEIINHNKVNHEHEDISDKWEITKAANCTAPGTRVRRCNVCKEIAVTETIAPLGHKWDEGIRQKAETCTSAGVMIYTCLNNRSHTKSEEIKALGHDFGEWKENTNGQEIRVCKNDQRHTQIREKGSDTPITNDKPSSSEETLSSEEFLSSEETLSSTEESSSDISDVSSETSSDTVSDGSSSATGGEVTPDMLSDEGIPTILIVILVGAAITLPILFIYMKRR